MIKLPGLIDPHVHMREPGANHKEDWDSGTKAALAGGYTIVLAMPNTDPPVTDEKSLALVESAAKKKARIDYGHFLGAAADNTKTTAALARKAAGLKMYLDQTYGPLCLHDMMIWKEHFLHWPGVVPIAVHAEERTLGAVLLMSALYDKSVHVCHVAKREEIQLIRDAKENGIDVTCEVTPHHLFLTKDDVAGGFPGLGEVRPRLATANDRQALWDNLDVIDCFATDHAPHTFVEKSSNDPPPGFPGLETALSLFLTAFTEGRLSLDDIISRMHSNPKRIFKLPEQEDTWIEIDEAQKWEFSSSDSFTRCGWSPFEGMRMVGRLQRVYLRGQLAYEDGEVTAQPGNGRNIRLP